MTQHENGNHYHIYKLWEKTLHHPYDYKHEGLMKRLLSHKITESPNTVLQKMVQIVESACVFCLQYVGVLENFHNYTKPNR